MIFSDKWKQIHQYTYLGVITPSITCARNVEDGTADSFPESKSLSASSRTTHLGNRKVHNIQDQRSKILIQIEEARLHICLNGNGVTDLTVSNETPLEHWALR